MEVSRLLMLHKTDFVSFSSHAEVQNKYSGGAITQQTHHKRTRYNV